MAEFTELVKGKKHILWDWNGTLLDDLDHIVSTVNHILQQNGLQLSLIHI